MMTRLFNIILGLICCAVFMIPIGLTWLAIKLSSRGPALYWSKRIGKDNEIFFMPKFRTMRVDTPQVATHLLRNSDEYLTSIGAFLRKSSLDELPQLWSVLSGAMSFVGPRPALFNQYDLMGLRTQYNIHQLPPGITGWAQINGRDGLSIEEKVKFDLEYLRRRSFIFDLKIMFLTLYKVISRKDISH